MNLFLPYEKDIIKSIESLDDARLNKQILECQTMLEFALGNTEAYGKHPVVKWYAQYPDYIAMYGFLASIEYRLRFNRQHKLCKYFAEHAHNGSPEVIPYYVEGSKTSPDCIRTTENVSELFQKKLIRKWKNGYYPPKWTNRDKPDFYKEYLKENNC